VAGEGDKRRQQAGTEELESEQLHCVTTCRALHKAWLLRIPYTLLSICSGDALQGFLRNTFMNLTCVGIRDLSRNPLLFCRDVKVNTLIRMNTNFRRCADDEFKGLQRLTDLCK